MRRETAQVRWTFTVGNYDPDAFDYVRHSVVARGYLMGAGHALVSEPVFESAEPYGPWKASTGRMTHVVYVADCLPRPAPTLRQMNDPEVPW